MSATASHGRCRAVRITVQSARDYVAAACAFITENRMSDYRSRSPIRSLIALGVHRWRHRKAIKELEALSDRELWDIGLIRNDIARTVKRGSLEK
ncbi:DUF1127 domain-containing protein [Aliihoeflea sp. 2WW]|uniref:DUF1127 domain-containing protein n=1 Tax=Aliihoeflea sp. 2WW TaxID=1381123 RepID=UPI000467A21C